MRLQERPSHDRLSYSARTQFVEVAGVKYAYRKSGMVANALSVVACHFKKIVAQFRQFLPKPRVGHRIEPAGANKPIEKPHALLTRTAAAPRQADANLSLIRRVPLAREVTCALHSLEQRGQCT
jgi:hypothetical protein